MIFSSNFMPCLSYFCNLINEPEIKININEQYRKQTYKNRANLLGPHKIETIIVPVSKIANNSPIKEVKIDYKENWQRVAWRTLESCYKNSPYFEYYDYLLQPIFEKKYTYLIDLNQESLSICLKILKVNTTICLDEFDYLTNKTAFITFNAKKGWKMSTTTTDWHIHRILAKCLRQILLFSI